MSAHRRWSPLLAGLRAALPDVEITHPAVRTISQDAVAVAADADAAIVVVGYTAADEGEYVGSFDPELAVLYPPSEDPNALTEPGPGVGRAARSLSGATGTRCGYTRRTRR